MTRPERPTVTGFWDYGLLDEECGCLNMVEVDMHGAYVVPCAKTPGDQLRHQGCPADGPCNFGSKAVP